MRLWQVYGERLFGGVKNRRTGPTKGRFSYANSYAKVCVSRDAGCLKSFGFASAMHMQKCHQTRINARKTRNPIGCGFPAIMARREGFEPPAFWSVGCSKEKTEPFRLRFTLFTAICWTGFPLFRFGIACSSSNLGQKWVKISSQAVFKAGMSFIKVSHTEGMSIEL